MSIKTPATSRVIMVSEDDSIEDAAKLMKQKNVGCVVVVKDKNSDTTPRGILTDRDIVIHLLANQIDSWKVSVKDIMSEELLILNEEQGIRDVIAAMRNKGVRRAPVVNNKGELVRFVSLDDILLLLADELKQVAALIKKQMG